MYVFIKLIQDGMKVTSGEKPGKKAEINAKYVSCFSLLIWW